MRLRHSMYGTMYTLTLTRHVSESDLLGTTVGAATGHHLRVGF